MVGHSQDHQVVLTVNRPTPSHTSQITLNYSISPYCTKHWNLVRDQGSEVQILSPRPIIFKGLYRRSKPPNRPPWFCPRVLPLQEPSDLVGNHRARTRTGSHGTYNCGRTLMSFKAGLFSLGIIHVEDQGSYLVGDRLRSCQPNPDHHQPSLPSTTTEVLSQHTTVEPHLFSSCL